MNSGISSPKTESTAGRAIVTRPEGKALSPLQLEDRATIYRGESARREVDAFRELRTRLLAVAEGNFITLVAPVSLGSGGSFVARNLAAAVAFDESKSAILVDCDLRFPSQHTTLRLGEAEEGLIDYLESRQDNVDQILYDTGVPRLRLMPAGKPRETGSEYFSSVRMQLLLDTLRTQPAAHIFLDSPPVRGAPDARILADLADVIILVAGYGRDTPAAISHAAASFDPNKFAGVVFNEGV